MNPPDAGGSAKDCESDRLHFFAAAAHALAVGAENPCGLFIYLTRGHHWDRLTLTAQDTARRRLQALEERPGVEPAAETHDCRPAGPARRRSSGMSTIPPEVRGLVRALAGRMSAAPTSAGRPVITFPAGKTGRGTALHVCQTRPIRPGLPPTGPPVLKHRAKTRMGPTRESEEHV